MVAAAARIAAKNDDYNLQMYWMDYKRAPHSQRSSSIVSREELVRSRARVRFQLHQAYAERLASSRDNSRKAMSNNDILSKGDILPSSPSKGKESNLNDGFKKNDGRESLILKNKPKRAHSVDQKVQKPLSFAENQKTIKSIVDDFDLFYEWITNGREDDISEETIKSLLFKKNKDAPRNLSLASSGSCLYICTASV